MTIFKKIGLVGRPGSTEVLLTLERLLAFLQKQGVEIIVEAKTAELVNRSDFRLCDREELSKHCDLVIVVGGDGSLLNIAKLIAAKQIPVIGVNRGRVGFLTDISPSKLEEQLSGVLSGEYSLDDRFLLDVGMRDPQTGTVDAFGSALNDVVLHPGIAAQMIEFELFIDEKFVYSQRSDGLIVATPTGSTAYSLSAGGPIMHPILNAIVVVPMYPHSLNSRPIVVDGDSEIRVVVSAGERLLPHISCDGQRVHEASAGDEIIISKKAGPLKLLHPQDHSFYQACRSKLGWGNRLVNKSD